MPLVLNLIAPKASNVDTDPCGLGYNITFLGREIAEMDVAEVT